MESVVTISAMPGASQTFMIEEPRGSFLTSAAVQRISYSVFSAISFAGAAVAASFAAGGALPMLFAAVPLAAVSVGLARAAYQLIDYDDPAALARIRVEVLKLPFPEIVLKHGWDNLFGYALIDDQTFERAYAEYVETISFGQLLRYYHEASSALKGSSPLNRFAAAQEYAIPSPECWKEKFEAETKDLLCDAIFTAYPLSDLKAFCLITEAQIEALEKTGKAVQKRNERDAALEREFLGRTLLDKSAFDRAVELARWTYRSHPAHAMLQQVDAEESLAISNLRSCIRARIQNEKSALESFRRAMAPSGGCLSREAHRALRCREGETEQRIAALQREEQDGISRIHWDAALRRLPINQMIYSANAARNAAIALANDEYRIRTMPVRKEVDRLKGDNYEHYKYKIEKLNQLYWTPS